MGTTFLLPPADKSLWKERKNLRGFTTIFPRRPFVAQRASPLFLKRGKKDSWENNLSLKRRGESSPPKSIGKGRFLKQMMIFAHLCMGLKIRHMALGVRNKNWGGGKGNPSV